MPNKENPLACFSSTQHIAPANRPLAALTTSAPFLLFLTFAQSKLRWLELLPLRIRTRGWGAVIQGVSIPNSSQRCLYLSSYFIVNTAGLWVPICFHESQHHSFSFVDLFDSYCNSSQAAGLFLVEH